MSEPRSFRFARHFRWSLLGQASTAVASFLATPYLIKSFGLETYGLYVILQSAVNYLMLASFGAGGAAVRHVAAANAEGDGSRLRSALRWSLLFHGPTVLLAAALFLSASAPLLGALFQVPPALMPSAQRVIWAAGVGAVFFSLSTWATTGLQGLSRFALSNAISFVQTGLVPVLAVVLAWAGFGLDAVAWCYAGVQAAGAAVAYVCLRRALTEAPAANGGDGLPFPAFVSWSFGQWMGQLAWIVSFQLDRVFAANLVSLTAMTLYAVPVGLLQRLNVLPATFNSVALPMLSELRTPGEELRRLYLRQYRLLLWLGLPGLVLLFSLMPQFLSLWLGGSFGDASVWPARLQVFAQGMALLCAMPCVAVLSHGKPWMSPALNWAQALVSLAAWALLVPRLGLVGVGWGGLLGQLLPALVFIPFIHARVLKLGLARYASEGLLAPALCAGVMLAVVFPFHDRAAGWSGLAVFTVMGLAAYGGTAWLLLGAEDRALVRRYASGRSR